MSIERQILDPGKRAKIAMIEKGIKPADIARELGLSVSYIYRLLTGAIVTRRGRRQIEQFLGEPIWGGGSAPVTGQPEEKVL